MTTALDMFGQIDDVFTSTYDAVRISKTGGGYVDGIWQDGTESRTTHPLTNIQQVRDRELEFLMNGGQRIGDTRVLYLNDGITEEINRGNEWEFFGQRWKVLKLDLRPLRNYCKIIVERIDDQ
jgi:hypothetical protein